MYSLTINFNYSTFLNIFSSIRVTLKQEMRYLVKYETCNVMDSGALLTKFTGILLFTSLKWFKPYVWQIRLLAAVEDVKCLVIVQGRVSQINSKLQRLHGNGSALIQAHW